ncbi:type I-E CRISPR-associated protein Cas6/Cse3/CasE [Candidatus Electrothrix sp.]|uniref:type I-E CRISPR-associated protein Cas6/Cse3/CasE n=1 Tax=Candidatus Electrothrix sp. TaxID=2170559 RepID=UPI004056D92D
MFFSKMTFQEHGIAPAERMRILRSPYALHQAVWQLFSDSPERERDFMYRLDRDGLRPVVYTVSEREPEDRSTVWQVAVKDYTPVLRIGTELGFLLRANPVVTKKDAQGRRRHDVVMDRKKTLQEQGVTKQDMPSSAELAQEAGWDWLACRAEQYGFTARQENVLVEGYRQEVFPKNRNGPKIRFSLLDFSGRLTVTDPDLFLRTLFRGMGPAKAFGCGLLLVRRI